MAQKAEGTQNLVSQYRCKEKCYCFRCELKIKDEHWEVKLWNVVKNIPIINIVYGIPRCIVMALKGDWTDSLKSLSRVIGGVGEIMVFTALGAVSPASSFAVAVGTATTALSVGTLVGKTGALLEMSVDHYVFKKNNLKENGKSFLNILLFLCVE